MTDFLTKISGQVTGPMIIGTLFPVVLFLVILVLVVLPVTPYGHQYTALLADPQSWKGIDAVVATLIILLSTVLLYQLNNPLIRLYEGYPWRNSWVGKLLCWRQKRHWNHAKTMSDRISKLGQGIRLEGIEGDFETNVDQVRDDYTRELIEQYPNEERLILPTRLGNVIRSFETYTNRRYGADAIVLWPRLQAILDANYAQAVDGVKAGFDFMLNASFLSVVLALLLAAAGIHWRHPWNYRWPQAWEAWTILFAGLSWLGYRGAINRAAEWGLSVKAAFDLYRLLLLQKLGYQITPSDPDEERKIWEVVSYQLSFPGDGLCCELPYRPPQVSLLVEPACTKLTAARTINPIDDSISEIRVVISNLDPSRLAAEMVAIKDQVATGFAYVPNSAVLGGAPVELLGVNPLHVQLGPLPYNETRTLVYRLKVQPKS